MIDQRIGKSIADDLSQHLGADYTCLWRKTKKGNWHLHCEADPGGRGIASYEKELLGRSVDV
jgi:hypothetical protein